jgi:NADH:ubiquinone oxidoreductase subunit 2 (subunit N)
VLSSLVSAYFYLGLIVKMYFAEPEGNHEPVRSGIAGITLAITTAASIVLGLFTTQLLSIFGTW